MRRPAREMTSALEGPCGVNGFPASLGLRCSEVAARQLCHLPRRSRQVHGRKRNSGRNRAKYAYVPVDQPRSQGAHHVLHRTLLHSAARSARIQSVRTATPTPKGGRQPRWRETHVLTGAWRTSNSPCPYDRSVSFSNASSAPVDEGPAAAPEALRSVAAAAASCCGAASAASSNSSSARAAFFHSLCDHMTPSSRSVRRAVRRQRVSRGLLKAHR